MDLNETKALIGRRIANARQSHGYSLKQFCLMIGLGRVTLSRIESGIGNPTIATLQRIADCLDIKLRLSFIE